MVVIVSPFHIESIAQVIAAGLHTGGVLIRDIQISLVAAGSTVAVFHNPGSVDGRFNFPTLENYFKVVAGIIVIPADDAHDVVRGEIGNRKQVRAVLIFKSRMVVNGGGNCPILHNQVLNGVHVCSVYETGILQMRRILVSICRIDGGRVGIGHQGFRRGSQPL